MGKEWEQRQKELEDLRMAAQQLVEVVDPQEGDAADKRSLLERLREALQKVLKFIAEAPITYVSLALGIVKSFWPKARLEVLAGGVAADYPLDKFEEYLEEVKPTAAKIVESLEQE